MNSKSHSSSVLVQGTILAIASLIVRLIGLLYRVPMTRIIGETGIGYYSTAFQVYNVVLLLSSYSMPQAVSKLMAARLVKRQYRNANRYFLCSLVVSVISGIFFSALMYFGADFIAEKMLHAPLAVYSIQMLAPTVLVMSFLGVFRGFFQGYRTMIPTAVSQVFEQIINAIVSIVGASVLFTQGSRIDLVKGTDSYAYALGAKGGTIGTFAGAVAALVFILFIFSLNYPSFVKRAEKEPATRVFRYKKVYRDIGYMVTPIIISTFIFHILNLIDNGIYGFYMHSINQPEDAYMAIWGVYSGKYQLLINLPIAFATAMASSIIPELTHAVEQRDRGAISQKIDISIRFTAIIAIPSMIGIAILGDNLVGLLFGNGASAANAGKMLLYGAAAVFLYSFATISNGILHGLGRMYDTVRNALIALAVHLVTLVLMLWIFGMKIYGVLFSYMLFGAVVSVLNSICIIETSNCRRNIAKTYVKPLIASIIMGAGVFGLNYVITTFGSKVIPSLAVVQLFAVLISVILGVLIYFATMILIRAVSAADLIEMPFGMRILRLARKMKLMK